MILLPYMSQDCPKCSRVSNEVKSIYCNQSCGGGGEHIHRLCLCGYSWLEETADTTARREEAEARERAERDRINSLPAGQFRGIARRFPLATWVKATGSVEAVGEMLLKAAECDSFSAASALIRQRISRVPKDVVLYTYLVHAFSAFGIARPTWLYHPPKP